MHHNRTNRWIWLMWVLFLLLAAAASAGAASLVNQEAPPFSLPDLGGQVYSLQQAAETPMLILYFFDAADSASQDGLIALYRLNRRFDPGDMTVWGITRSPKEMVEKVVSGASLNFPILLDEKDVSDRYQARQILPTSLIIGPGLRVLNHVKGGGKGKEVFLAQLAERMIQRKKAEAAIAISETLQKTTPDSPIAKLIQAEAHLSAGAVDQAEAAVTQVMEKEKEMPEEAAIPAQELMAQIQEAKGNDTAALAIAERVERRAPERGNVNVVKANILLKKGEEKAAAAELVKAEQKPDTSPTQRAAAQNKLGLLAAKVGNDREARVHYQGAVALNPYDVEPMSNQGVLLERQGNLSQALAAFQQAAAADPSDLFAAALTRGVERKLAYRNDAEKKKRLDSLIKSLSERYRKQQAAPPQEVDEWTSRPMVLSFVDIREQGILPFREGVAQVVADHLSELLNSSGRVRVVERAIIDTLLEELNLGSSELADPDTALRLGRVLGARLIGTGSLLYLPDGTLLSLRLVDSETTVIAEKVSRQIPQRGGWEKELDRINREILKTIIAKYPLKGFVVQPDGGEIMVNLGENQGVVLGTTFDVVAEPEPIRYKGKLLKASPKPFAQIKVVRLEPGFSLCKVVQQERPISRDDKVIEAEAGR